MYPTRTNKFKEHQQKNMILFNLVFLFFLIELIYLIHLVLFDFLNLFNFSIHVNSLDFGLLGHLFFYFLNLTKDKNKSNIKRTKTNLKMILFILSKFHSFNQNGLHFGLLVHFKYLLY